MPKLPLGPDDLRALSASAAERARAALRHPRRTAAQVVSGSVGFLGAVVGTVRERSDALRRPAPERGATAPTPASPPPPVLTEEESLPSDDRAGGVPPAVPADVAAEGEPVPPEHLRGPAPHMPAALARDIERDFDDDIPGISSGRPD